MKEHKLPANDLPFDTKKSEYETKKLAIFSVPHAGGEGNTLALQLLYEWYAQTIRVNPLVVDFSFIDSPRWMSGIPHSQRPSVFKMQDFLDVVGYNIERESSIVIFDSSKSIEFLIKHLNKDIFYFLDVDIRFLHVVNNNNCIGSKMKQIDRFEHLFPGKNLIVANEYTPSTQVCSPGFNSQFLPNGMDFVVMPNLGDNYARFGCVDQMPLTYLASIYSERLIPKDFSTEVLQFNISDFWPSLRADLAEQMVPKWVTKVSDPDLDLSGITSQLDRFFYGLSRMHHLVTTPDMLRSIRSRDSAGLLPLPIDDMERYSRIRRLPNMIRDIPQWGNMVETELVIGEFLNGIPGSDMIERSIQRRRLSNGSVWAS